MKYGTLYLLLLLFLLVSCGKQRLASEPMRPDSARVAWIFYKKIWAVSALDSVERYANLTCRYLSDKELTARVNYGVALRCMKLGMFERALVYYRKTGDGADAWIQGEVCRAMPEAYAGMGRYLDAVRCLDSIRDCRQSRSVIPHYCLAKGNLYAMTGQVDSACRYYESAARSLNRWVAGVASRRLSAFHASRGKDSLAYNLALKADKILIREIQKEEATENRENYEKEKMQNELNRLRIDKQRQEIMVLSLGLIVVLIVFVFYFVWQRRKRQTDLLLLQEKTIRLEQTRQLLVQAEELTLLREKESQLRESLFRRMKSFHKIPSLEDNDRKETDTNLRIALSKEDWDDIRQTVDKSYDNFTQRLKQSFPSLSEKDVNFCCLVKIGVSIKDLSDIYCISRTSVSRKKQRVKKDKFGLTAEDDTLDSFLRHF